MSAILTQDGKPYDQNGIVQEVVSTELPGFQDGPASRREVALHIAKVGQQIADGALKNQAALEANQFRLKTTVDQIVEGHNDHEDRLRAIEKVLAMRTRDQQVQ